MRVMDVVMFICAREQARLRPSNVVLDPIVAAYRFCNMRREDDRVTRWIANNWRDPNSSHPECWFAMCVARMALNEIGTMQELGFPIPWDASRFLSVVENRILRKKRIYNPAYMIATPNWTGPKHQFLVQKLLGPMWEKRESIRPRENDTLRSFFNRLHDCYGAGSFTTAQVVADMKYTPVFIQATDWWTWASPGPGSKRGLNRVFGREVSQPWQDYIWLEHLNKLQIEVNKFFHHAPFHAQDLQNVMCEFDKYERARLGEGRPKQKYVPFDGVNK